MTLGVFSLLPGRPNAPECLCHSPNPDCAGGVAGYVVVAKVGLHLPLVPVGGVLLFDLVVTVVGV